ncbi:GNAT family N-acetyltransferase [Nonomuraea diastatica]|nr:GNAT family N-acetyltransferase [Nonomuraea diastatica]
MSTADGIGGTVSRGYGGAPLVAQRWRAEFASPGGCGGHRNGKILHVDVHLLAKRPDLIHPLAEIRWREWGGEPGLVHLSDWVRCAEQEAGHHELPVTFVAVDEAGDVLGGVGLAPYDLEECRDRSPWIIGMIVRADLRGRGVGQALVDHLERWAVGRGVERMWVATDG